MLLSDLTEGLTLGGATPNTLHISQSGLQNFLLNPIASQSSSEILLNIFNTSEASYLSSLLANLRIILPIPELSFLIDVGLGAPHPLLLSSPHLSTF